MKLPKKERKYTIKDEIDSMIANMSKMDPLSDDYKTMTERLEKLTEAEQRLSPRRDKRCVDPNVFLTAGFSVAEILLIMNYEQVRPIVTKAFGRIIKARF